MSVGAGGGIRSPDRVALARGGAPVYLGTRLFEYSERLLSAAAEEALARGLRQGLVEQGVEPVDNLVFLPFRDSNEALGEFESTVPLSTKEIYELDVAAIRSSYAVVALLNDPHKASGVCFEVGYAAALGKPLVPVVNDIIDYRYVPWGKVLPLDPIICSLAGPVLKEAAVAAAGDRDRRRLYRAAQEAGIARLGERLTSLGSELVAAAERYVPRLPQPLPPGPRPRVHLEFGGGLYEWQRLLVDEALRVLGDAGRGYDISVATRYVDTGRPLDVAVLGDVAATLSTDVLVTLADGADMDAEVSALQGLARGTGKRILIYYSGAVRWVAATRDVGERNAMVEHSADAIVHSLRELPEAIEHVL